MEAWKEKVEADQRRDDFRFASLMAVMANCHRGKRGKAFSAYDFMQQSRPARSGEELQAKWSMIMAALEAKGKTKTHGTKR